MLRRMLRYIVIVSLVRAQRYATVHINYLFMLL